MPPVSALRAASPPPVAQPAAPRTGAAPAENLRGAGLMTASMIGFACSDACLKLAGEHLPLFQILFLRGIGTTLILVALALPRGGRPGAASAGGTGALIARPDPGRDRRRLDLHHGAHADAASPTSRRSCRRCR